MSVGPNGKRKAGWRKPYFKSENLRLHERERFAVDFDETFASLESLMVGKTLFWVDRDDWISTLQCATAVAARS